MVIVVEKVADVGFVDAASRVRTYAAGLRPPAGHDSWSHTREGGDAPVSVADLARFADFFGDLADRT